MTQQLKKLRLIMVVCLILSTFSSLYSQGIDSKQYNYVGNWYNWQGGRFITNLNIPKVQATTGRDTGAVYYRLADSSILVWTGSQWRQIGGGGSGSADSSVFATRYYTQQTFVPYTGATGSVNLGAFGLTTDRLVFNQSPTLAGGVGILRWNDTDGTLEFGMKGGNVTQQIGQELPVRMRNNTGSTILNGEAVYISGSTGSSTTISKAKADASLTSKTTIGILTEDIPNGQSGFVTTFGKVRDINTSALTEGELVYLSATTAGGLTSIAPTGDTYVVIIGVCERSHAVNGVIFVNVDKQYIRQYEIDTSVARIDSILDTKLSYHLINGATNLGSGAQVFKDTSSNKINLRSIIGTDGVTVTQNTNDITISGNADSSAARVRSGTYATRIAISSPEDGEIFTQTDRLSGMYIYNQGTWRFQGDPLYFWYYTNFTRGQTVNTAAEGYNTGPLALTGAASSDFIVNQKPYSDGWLRALLKASDVTVTVPGFDSLEVDSVIVWHETEILVDAVSDGTDSYGVSWGYDNAAGTYTSGDRIVLRYNHAASSGNWESRTVAAGSGTWTTKDTGVPFVAGTRMKLAIEIDGYARVIRFYINDALVTTHTSPDNVPFPNATTLVTGISPSMFNFDRLAGSTTRSFEVNYMFGYIIKKNF